MILSYASTLDAFSRYLEKHGYREADECNIYGIVSGSEMLKDSTREILEKAFNCKVVSRYANEENGFIGQDEKINNVFLHNRANYYIEILKFDSDTPVDENEIGRIVITDLYNHSMPLVRYDTGDVGTWQTVKTGKGERKAIGKFGGRRVDMIFDTDRNIISPHAITNRMWEFPEIIQYQFVQEDWDKYKMKINSETGIDEEKLLKSLRKAVGASAKIEIEYVSEIPTLASGKRKYIVNQISK